MECPNCGASLLPRHGNFDDGDVYKTRCGSCKTLFAFKTIPKASDEWETEVVLNVNGMVYTVSNVDPSTTLNEWIRTYIPNLKGTKRSCAEGGCGACIVALTYAHGGSTVTRAVNSCLHPLLSCNGCVVTTIEGIGSSSKGYHPLQKKLADGNGSQCGFCSSGMVMNMYSLLKENPKPTMLEIEDAFDGNICRCTGYRPILDAMKSFAVDAPENVDLPSCSGPCGGADRVKGKCNGCEHNGNAAHDSHLPYDIEDLCKRLTQQRKKSACITLKTNLAKDSEFSMWYHATNLADVFELFKKFQNKRFKLVVGNTSRGVFPNPIVDVWIDMRDIQELTRIDASSSKGITLGAAVSICDLIETLTSHVQISPGSYIELAKHLALVANRPIRNVACWAGNLMMAHDNPDFASDIFTIMMTVGATLSIQSSPSVKPMPYSLSDFLSLDMNNKVIISINIPVLNKNEVFRSFKVMPRHVNAHAYVNAGLRLTMDPVTSIVSGSPLLVFGGINAHAIRASETESFLVNKRLSEKATLAKALSILYREIKPDSSLILSSIDYRRSVVVSLFYKFYLSVANKFISDERLHSATIPFVRPISCGTQTFGSDPSEYPVSKALPKLASILQTSGEAQFADDLPVLPGMLFGAIVVSQQGNATLKSINPTDALKLPGVVRFISAEDIRGKNSFAPSGDKEVLFGEIGAEILYAGQPLGIILADTQRRADGAAKLVVSTYSDVKPPILLIEDAIKANSFWPSTQLPTSKSGNVDAGLKSAHHVVQDRIRVGSQYHFHLETQSAAVIPEDNGNTYRVFASTQWPDLVQESISQATNIPAHDVQISVKRLGGAFGAKITRNAMLATAVAVASQVTGTPVTSVMSIGTNMEAVGKRHPFVCDYTVGFEDSGLLTAIRMTLFANSGSCPNDSMGAFSMAITASDNAYYCPNWSVSGKLCKTHMAANTSMRAPGCVPAIYFAECIVDRVALELQISPEDVRLLNMYRANQTTPYGQNLPYCSIRNLWDDMHASTFVPGLAQVKVFNKANRWRKRGIAMTPIKYGIAQTGAQFGCLVNIYQSDGTVCVTHSGIEMGQGINVKVAQVTAYKLGIPIESVRIGSTNTTIVPNAIATGGSIGSELNCAAVIRACDMLLERMAPIKARLKNPSWTDIVTACYGASIDLSARYWLTKDTSPAPFAYNSYGVACSQVELDVLTGEVQILQCDVVMDCGTSLNPDIDIGQLEGSFVMGLGYWLTERLVFDDDSGKVLSNGTWEYKPPSAKDIPISFNVSLLKDAPNPSGVLRSKASGEPPYCLSCVVMFALKRAINASIEEYGGTSLKDLSGPATVDITQQLCGVDLKQLSMA